MQKKKKAVSLLLAAVLALSACPFGYAELDQKPEVNAQSSANLPNGNLALYTENAKLALYYNDKTTEIAVQDKKSGDMWYSNPQNRNTDPYAKGINSMMLNSQLNVKYINASKQTSVVNNYVGSINRDGVTTEKITDGIKIIYNFPRKSEMFTIPIQYVLKDDHLEASVLFGEIKEEGANQIIEIAFLPCFGAGGEQDEGYIFVPDGSGAIINYNNGKQFLPQYAEEVYGRDPILSKTFDNFLGQDIRLPVYGMKTGDSACLGVIDQGAALAMINTQISGNTDSYNRVWPAFTYRIRDAAMLAEKDSSAKEVTLFSEGHADTERCQINFYFLGKDQANYSGMAVVYRSYLEKKYGFARQSDGKSYPFFATFFGGAKKKESVFGIPLSLYHEMTSYDAVAASVGKLLELGVESPVVAYKGWANGGLKSKVSDKVRFEGNLGGKKDFLALQSYLKEENIPFYPSADFINLYQNGRWTFSFFDAVKTVSRAPALQYSYLLSTQTKNPNLEPWYLLKLEKTTALVESYIKSAEKYDLNLLSDSLGRIVYTQVNKHDMTDREDVAKLHQQLLASVECDLLLENPNAYALSAAKQIINLPSSDSGYDTVDYAVPFYQMVLHGYVDYALEPSNTEGRGRDYFLKVLEYGAGLQYWFTEKGTDQLKDTEFNYLYATRFDDYAETAAAEYQELASVLGPLQDKEMTGHRWIKDTLAETSYSDGTRILVNYDEVALTVDGNTIPAKGWYVVKGAAENE